MPDDLLLALALACSLAGAGWLALASDAHWHQVSGLRARTVLAGSRVLRVQGTIAWLVSLGLCLRADHATIAVLAWVMSLSAGTVAVAFLLAWRPGWLAWLVVRGGRVSGESASR